MSRRSMFRAFEDDPFFADHSDQLRRMDDMFASPFRGINSLEDGQDRSRTHDGNRVQSMQLLPFGELSFGSMFGNMDKMIKGMMTNMDKAFTEASSCGGNGYGYQQASFMSYNNTGQGAPKVFQASTATRTGPGGVRETRKALRDSERELEKMSIGHHIMDRGHEVEKHKNLRTNYTEEFQNFHNIDEKDAESFNQEWREKTKQALRGVEYGSGRDQGRRAERRKLTSARDLHREEHRALPEPPSSYWDDQDAMPESKSSKEAISEHWDRTAQGKHWDRS